MSFMNPSTGLTELIEHGQFLVSQPALRRGTVATLRAGAGFTIVELLIVIVVIGILAAIVIVAFNGVQTRANDTAVRADLSQVAKKLELFIAEYGTYPVSLADLTNASVAVNKDLYVIGRNNLYYRSSSTHYILGTIPKSASTGQVCVVDGKITTDACNSHANVSTLFTNLGFGASTYSTSWHVDPTGWQTFVGG